MLSGEIALENNYYYYYVISLTEGNLIRSKLVVDILSSLDLDAILENV